MKRKLFRWIYLYRSIHALLFLFLASCSDISLEKTDSLPFVNNILLSVPAGEELADGYSLVEKIIDRISKAKATIDMAIYLLDHEKLVETLISAHNVGISIRVVSDESQKYSAAQQELQKAGIPVKFGNRRGIMHHKFILIDNESLIFGTGNFTINGFFRNDNVFLFTENQDLINAYLNEFLQMYHGRFGSDKNDLSDTVNQHSGDSFVHYFSPQDKSKIQADFIAEIDRAEESIHFMIYSFSLDWISDALIRAAQRGVKIIGVIDKSFLRGVSQEAPRLYSLQHPNLMIRVDGNEETIFVDDHEEGGKLHTKIMLIDGLSDNATTIIGSFNWSQSGLEDNDENFLILKSSAVTERLEIYFNQIYAKSSDPSALGLTISGDAIGKKLTSADTPDGKNCLEYMLKEKNVLISEIYWQGSSAGSNDQMLELYNTSECPIQISHWKLEIEDQDGFLRQWTIPDQTNAYQEKNSLPENYRIRGLSYLVFYKAKAATFDGILCTGDLLKSDLCSSRLPNERRIYNCNYQNGWNYCLFNEKILSLPAHFCRSDESNHSCLLNNFAFCSEQAAKGSDQATLELCRVRSGDIMISSSASFSLSADVRAIRLFDKNGQIMDEIIHFPKMLEGLRSSEKSADYQKKMSLQRKGLSGTYLLPEYYSQGPMAGKIISDISATLWDSSAAQNWCMSASLAGNEELLQKNSRYISKLFFHNGFLMYDFRQELFASPHMPSSCL